MSAYSSPPIAPTGALSLGTTGGVGSDMACTGRLCCCDMHGSWWGCSHAGKFWNDVTGTDGYLFFATDNGVQSVCSTNFGSAIDSECGYVTSSAGTRPDSIEYVNHDLIMAYYWDRMYSFSHSNGILTYKDVHRPSCWCVLGVSRQMWSLDDHNIIFVTGCNGIYVYCYNSNGVLGHTDYESNSDVCAGCGIYVYNRNGCCMVVMSRANTWPYSDGLALWCFNTSSCTLGNYCCRDFAGNSTDGWIACHQYYSSNSPYLRPGRIWGGCETGCDLSDGGFFIVASPAWNVTSSGYYTRFSVVCTYADGSNACFCIKSQLNIPHFTWDLHGDGKYIYAISGGRLSAAYHYIYQLSFNCSTGVLTCMQRHLPSTCCVLMNDRHGIWTNENSKIYVTNRWCQDIGVLEICKPDDHLSISGFYGGADNTDVSLSHYYKGGSYVTNNSSNANVPTSGSSIDFSDFYGQG